MNNRDFMSRAYVAAQQSNCIRRSVGAVLVRAGQVISSGANGVPQAFSDCGRAGCPRCLRGGRTGLGYESCICIHAEQKAIAEAARLGVPAEGSSLYVTLRPCLQCLAIVKAAGIEVVIFDEEWKYDEPLETVYEELAKTLPLFESLKTSEERASGENCLYGRLLTSPL
jgi:dCMP deaminase